MDERPGIRVCKDRRSITAAATPTLVYQVTTGRTARLVKLVWYNGQAADITLEIGTYDGATFTRRLPRIRAITRQHDGLSELECPEFEFESDIYAQASAAAAAPNDVEVIAVVNEIG